MAVQTQIYEWMNLAADGPDGRGFEINRSINARPVSIQPNSPVDIFTGGIGNNISTQPKVKANEFIVIENLLCCPFQDGAVQVRINSTEYFQNPDYSPMIGNGNLNGIPGMAIPYPCGSSTGRVPLLDDSIQPSLDSINPSIYILPGQTWSVLYTTRQGITGLNNPSNDGTSVGVVVQYTLYSGTDSLIALKLLDMGLPVTPNNADWLKRKILKGVLL